MESNSSKYDEEVEYSRCEEVGGVGRYYECVFCKRGFNTAQALGGHMNIHRKDRPRNKPAAKSSPNLLLLLQHHSPPPPPPPLNNYHHNHIFNYFPPPPPASSTPFINGRGNYDHHHQPHYQHQQAPLNQNRKEELDLELRLGYFS